MAEGMIITMFRAFGRKVHPGKIMGTEGGEEMAVN
jgi:hypothetical protein